MPFLGLGTVPAVMALVLYSQLTLVRNVAVGLRRGGPGGDRGGAGHGHDAGAGASGGSKLPLALPVILAGMRIATLAIISLTTIAAWIGAGGLGQMLRDGVQRDDNRLILAGVLAVTALAPGGRRLYRLIEWLNTGYLRSPQAARLAEAVDAEEPIKLA